MLELSVHAKSPLAIAAAFKKIKEMVKTGSLSDDAPVHLTLSPGQYHELLSYNLANPLIMEPAAGTRSEDCVISAENCEAFHHGSENRAVFTIGMAATQVTLRGFTIENTHVKANGVTTGNQAEAFYWHNKNGALFAENMRFISRQNTVQVQGVSHFKHCYVTGDVDYIWGACELSLWEACTLHTRADNREGDHAAYAVQSRALAAKSGFVFSECSFTADIRTEKAPIYLARANGNGAALSAEDWDSIALINCTVSPAYDSALWSDENGTVSVYPPIGSATSGWREYGTKTASQSGHLAAADTTKRSVHGYLLSNKEYFARYASTALILGAYAGKFAP